MKSVRVIIYHNRLPNKQNNLNTFNMTKTILKSALFGAFFGAILFFVPGFILTMLIMALIFKLVFRRKMRSGKFQQHRLAFMDKVRNMSEEEYAQFKNNFSNGRCRAHCQTC